MLVPKIQVNAKIDNNKLYELIKDGLDMAEIKEVKQALNHVEVITEWSRFELRLDGEELSIHQRWTKDKMPVIVGLVIISLFIWLPFLFIGYLVYTERKTSKKILGEITVRLNNKN